MAEFSKQWIDKYDKGGMKPDFDIEEVASGLGPDMYTPLICEGFGFIAIGKSQEGEILLEMPQPYKAGEEEMIMWKPMNEVITEQLNEDFS